jgi:dihydroorotate dehydrogenase (NAD+) catalytic subunit
MIELTRHGKNTLTVETPVMPAAGTLGYGDLYRDLIDFEKLGAFVTNPVTAQPWSPASGTRVVPLDAGVLMHTGLPNPGLTKIISKYRAMWKVMPLPVIVHVIATTVEDIRRCVSQIDREDSIDAIELGLNDEVSLSDADWFVHTAVEKTEKPIIVRLPLTDIESLGRTAADAGADALVVSAPPRGTARDAGGRLIGGRIYGPLVKPIVLRVVGQMVRKVDIPIIGAGGIHSPEDARDYLEAGARAVQVDSVTWVQPKMLEIIARDLGGLVLTRAMGALLDEWHPGIGATERDGKSDSSTPDTTKETK